MSKEGETALDVVAYGARIAAALGANIIKVKLPSPHIELEADRKVYGDYRIPRETLAECVRHVMQSAFGGRRLVLFSGGPKEDEDRVLLEEVRAIRGGRGLGVVDFGYRAGGGERNRLVLLSARGGGAVRSSVGGNKNSSRRTVAVIGW